MAPFNIGDRVRWDWGGNTASGTITDRYTKRVSRRINGAEIVRNADPENPAYLIKQEDGDRVLKSHSELSDG